MRNNHKYRDRDWLYTESYTNGLGTTAIARKCWATPRTIRKWKKQYNIPNMPNRFHGKRYSEEARRKSMINHLMPDHPNANCNGCVLESRLIMEHELGRYLGPLEVVHHIDRDVSNNNPENLRLFECNGKHSTFHLNEKRYAKYVTSV